MDIIQDLKYDNNDIYTWKLILCGPKNTLYENGKFDMQIKFTENYPIEAPIIKFTCGVKHINVNSYGNICLDVLKQWSFEYNIKYLLLSIYTLLSEPNYDDPFDSNLLELYKNNYS